jgi:hypothetical protein
MRASARTWPAEAAATYMPSTQSQPMSLAQRRIQMAPHRAARTQISGRRLAILTPSGSSSSSNSPCWSQCGWVARLHWPQDISQKCDTYTCHCGSPHTQNSRSTDASTAASRVQSRAVSLVRSKSVRNEGAGNRSQSASRSGRQVSARQSASSSCTASVTRRRLDAASSIPNEEPAKAADARVATATAVRISKASRASSDIPNSRVSRKGRRSHARVIPAGNSKSLSN